MRILLYTSITAVFFSVCLTSLAGANCSRCIKIEKERAREQAANPQPWNYYDDPKNLPPNEKTPSTLLKPCNELENQNLKNDSLKDGLSTSAISTIDASEILSKNTDMLALNTASTNPGNRDPFFFQNEGISNSSEDQESNSSNALSQNGSNRAHPQTLLSPFSSSSYSALFTIFNTKNFIETLNGSFTLFLPTNEAFKLLPPAALNGLFEPKNQERLAAIVSNHIVAKKLLANDFVENKEREIKAISGKNLTLSSNKGKLFIDGVEILRLDPAGNDGIIYVIEKVLTP